MFSGGVLKLLCRQRWQFLKKKEFEWNHLFFSLIWSYSPLAEYCFFSSYQLNGMSYRMCYGKGWLGTSTCVGRNCFQKQCASFFCQILLKKNRNPYRVILDLFCLCCCSYKQWRTVSPLCHWQTWLSTSQKGLCTERRMKFHVKKGEFRQVKNL